MGVSSINQRTLHCRYIQSTQARDSQTMIIAMIFLGIVAISGAIPSPPEGMNSTDAKNPDSVRSQWKCPEYGVDFYGYVLEEIAGIQTWQRCGEMCHAHKTCAFWTWTQEIL